MANIGGEYIEQLKGEIDEEMAAKVTAGSVVYGRKKEKGGMPRHNLLIPSPPSLLLSFAKWSPSSSLQKNSPSTFK